jgi:hypothetical protein
MRRHLMPPAHWAALFLSLALLAQAFALSGCSCVRFDEPITETQGAIVATGTVQAPLPGETTASANAPQAQAASSSPAAAAPAPQQQTPLTKAPQTQEVAPPPSSSAKATNPYATPPPMSSNIWPVRLGKFAAALKIPVWYPKQLPKGYKVLSCDTVEYEPGSGLVADTVFTDGNGGLNLRQGSPKARGYQDMVPAGKVPWGTEQADIVYQDPISKSSPMIVYYKGGTMAELEGTSITFEQLKAVAASMVPVR